MTSGRRASVWMAVLAVAAGCAPRQAVVRSDPRGGEMARLEVQAAIRADLETLRVAQEEHRMTTARYSYDAREMGFLASPGIQIDILEATADGFSALGRGGTNECALFVGSADPPRSYARVSGEIACRS